MASDIWAEARQLASQGRRPVITLSPATEVREAKKPPHRPRKVKDSNKPFAHYPMHTPSGGRMRCRAPGCSNQIRAGVRAIVCSERCEALLREECEAILAVLNGEVEPEEFPPHLRTNGRRKKRHL